MQNIKKILLILTFVMGITGLYGKDENTQNLVNMAPTYKDVLVATVKNDNGENRDLRMNVFVPKTNNKKVPLLVFVHGGGWAMGDYQGDDKSNNNHVNFYTNYTLNLDYVLYFYPINIPSQQFTNISSDIGVRYGIQFLMTNSQIIQWFFVDLSERNSQLDKLNLLFNT